jgi:hypothetical protein
MEELLLLPWLIVTYSSFGAFSLDGKSMMGTKPPQQIKTLNVEDKLTTFLLPSSVSN